MTDLQFDLNIHNYSLHELEVRKRCIKMINLPGSEFLISSDPPQHKFGLAEVLRVLI